MDRDSAPNGGYWPGKGPEDLEMDSIVSDPDHGFEFGLQRVLDGIEVLVRQRGG